MAMVLVPAALTAAGCGSGGNDKDEPRPGGGSGGALGSGGSDGYGGSKESAGSDGTGGKAKPSTGGKNGSSTGGKNGSSSGGSGGDTCNDACTFAGDGECDEPDLCDPGTDCSDCSEGPPGSGGSQGSGGTASTGGSSVTPASGGSSGAPASGGSSGNAGCYDTCAFARDGTCNEPDPCDPDTDCADCAGSPGSGGSAGTGGRAGSGGTVPASGGNSGSGGSVGGGSLPAELVGTWLWTRIHRTSYVFTSDGKYTYRSVSNSRPCEGTYGGNVTTETGIATVFGGIMLVLDPGSHEEQNFDCLGVDTYVEPARPLMAHSPMYSIDSSGLLHLSYGEYGEDVYEKQ
jgi:hypothetical protein